MTEWTARSSEERALLNPGFCATLIWCAATGHASPLPFETSFLVLPMILHRETRETLPRSLRTSLPVWLEENPLARTHISDRARALVPFTKEALFFGGLYGLISFAGGTIRADSAWKKRVDDSVGGSSDEVQSCAKRAEFLGRWFEKSGNAATVMALIGVRP